MCQLLSPQAIPWVLMVFWLLCHPARGDLEGSGALNGVLYGPLAGISYGDPTSFLKLWTGDAVDPFTEDPTDLQPFLSLGQSFDSSSACATPVPTFMCDSHTECISKTLARKGGSLQATFASVLQPTLWQGSAEGLVIVLRR